MSEPKSCEWVDREPVYIKSIAGMQIDRSEWEGDKGAFFRYKETPCRLAADAGHKFCPKHELQELERRKNERLDKAWDDLGNELERMGKEEPGW